MPATNLQRRSKDPWNPRFSRSFVVCAAIAVVTGSGLIVGARRILAEDRFEQHTFDVTGRLQEARASMRSAISNMRAFMLTGEDSNQKSCLADLSLTHDQFDQLSDMLGPGLSQTEVSNLYAESNTIASLTASAMSARSEYGAAMAPKLGDDPKLAAAIQVIENDLGAQLSLQNNLLDTHRERRQDDFFLTQIAFACTMFFGTLSLVLAGVGLAKEAAERQAAEVKHANAKQDLQTVQAMLDLADQKDPLTGLLNRDAFEAIFEQEYAKSMRTKAAISLVLMEVDQVAQIREIKGAETADAVLRQTAGILKDCFRGGDVCCRFGDTLFAILMPRTPLQSATIAAERARTSIEKAEWANCNVTASFGAAQADFLKDRSELINRAEQAVDYAKRTGRNRVTAIRAYLPLSA